MKRLGHSSMVPALQSMSASAGPTRLVRVKLLRKPARRDGAQRGMACDRGPVWGRDRGPPLELRVEIDHREQPGHRGVRFSARADRRSEPTDRGRRGRSPLRLLRGGTWRLLGSELWRRWLRVGCLGLVGDARHGSLRSERCARVDRDRDGDRKAEHDIVAGLGGISRVAALPPGGPRTSRRPTYRSSRRAIFTTNRRTGSSGCASVHFFVYEAIRRTSSSPDGHSPAAEYSIPMRSASSWSSALASDVTRKTPSESSAARAESRSLCADVRTASERTPLLFSTQQLPTAGPRCSRMGGVRGARRRGRTT